MIIHLDGSTSGLSGKRHLVARLENRLTRRDVIWNQLNDKGKKSDDKTSRIVIGRLLQHLDLFLVRVFRCVYWLQPNDGPLSHVWTWLAVSSFMFDHKPAWWPRFNLDSTTRMWDEHVSVRTFREPSQTLRLHTCTGWRQNCTCKILRIGTIKGAVSNFGERLLLVDLLITNIWNHETLGRSPNNTDYRISFFFFHLFPFFFTIVWIK